MKSLLKFALFLLTSLSMVAQWYQSPFPSAAPAVGYQFTPAFTNISWGDPWRPEQMAVFGGKLYVWSKDQRVTLITNTAAPNRTVFLDNLPLAFSERDSGMPGLVFHPNGTNVFTFATEKRYSPGATNFVDVLRKWTLDPSNPNRVLPVAQSQVLIEQADRSNEHLGGAMFFGADGYLYLSLSDEGGQNGVLGNTQRIDKDFFSGVIRIDVDGKPGNLPPTPHPAIRGSYWVPSDNPWVGATNFNGQPVDPAKVRTEFWAVGLRNPHTMVRDSVSGRVFIGDVGNLRWESLFELERGANFGWNWYEGPEATLFVEAPPIASRPQVQFKPPLWTYPHAAIATSVGATDQRYTGNCIIAGIVYRGTKYPNLNGKLICSDYMNGNVWAVSLGANPSVEWIGFHPTGATAWSVDPATGDILAASISGGTISRMVPASYTQPIPPTISATGLFTDVAAFAIKPEVFPYNVANPFWSDGAVKERWFALPPGGVVARDTANDSWNFPPGTFWMKHFNLDGRRLETRFLVKTASGAYGLTYKWREDPLDADLVSDQGESLVLASGQPWRFPAWSECSTCHNSSSGAAGFSTRQLNTTAEVAGVGPVNQLEEFSLRGVFSPPILSALALPKLSRPTDTNFSLAHRFKSYTDANCSYCHYPGGPGRGEWDARFNVPLEVSSIINGSVGSDLGIVGAAVVVPGDQSKSVLFHRIADWTESGPAEYHMPPLGTFRPNTAGINLVAEFIASIAPRTNWMVGTNGPSPEPYREFSVENRINDPAPGSATLLDDDYYTAGSYPAGFNGLTAPLVVEVDEPWVNWERALTHSDRTNRLHFVTTAGPAALVMSLNRGGALTNGVAMAPVTHAITVTHKTGSATNQIAAYLINGNVVLTAPFTAGDGPNTIEFVRTGPTQPGCSYWMTFDSIKITR